jgi:hypothetical protein
MAFDADPGVFNISSPLEVTAWQAMPCYLSLFSSLALSGTSYQADDIATLPHGLSTGAAV